MTLGKDWTRAGRCVVVCVTAAKALDLSQACSFVLQAWEYRSDPGNNTDTLTHQWLKGFVESVGSDTASLLLRDNGLPREYRVDNSDEWRVQTGSKVLQNSVVHKRFLGFVERKRSNETTAQ